MPKFKVKLDYKAEKTVEAMNKDEAVEIFCQKFEDELGHQNTTLENEVWGSVKVKKTEKTEKADY